MLGIPAPSSRIYPKIPGVDPPFQGTPERDPHSQSPRSRLWVPGAPQGWVSLSPTLGGGLIPVFCGLIPVFWGLIPIFGVSSLFFVVSSPFFVVSSPFLGVSSPFFGIPFPCSLRSSSSKLAQLTLEQILEHLDNLRLNLTNTKQNFFSQTPILQALQHVQASCDEAHKMKFSDLFSLAEEYEDSSSKPPKSRRKATALSSPRSRKNAAQPPNNEEESGSSSASEEEDTKPKPAKRKRKGSSAVGSDSD